MEKKKKRREKVKGTGEKTDRDSWVCRAAGCLIERGFLWARVDISVNEAFPRKPGGGHSCGEGLRHQWGCEGKAPALSIAILSSVAIKGFLTCHGGFIACFKDGRVILFCFYFSFLLSLPLCPPITYHADYFAVMNLNRKDLDDAQHHPFTAARGHLISRSGIPK